MTSPLSSRGRRNLELPPLRTRLWEAWPYTGGFFGLLVGPFFVFPLTDIALGWGIGIALYLVIWLVSPRPLYDYLSSDPEFGLDEQGRVHVLSNEKEAFTPDRDWDPRKEARAFRGKVALGLCFYVVVTMVTGVALEFWEEAVVISAFAGFSLVLSVAEPLRQIRGRRRFGATRGGIILNPLTFGPIFRAYVASDRFDPNDRTPHIDTVLHGAFQDLDQVERVEMATRTKEDMMSRAHGRVATGSLAKLLRVFGG